MNIIIIFCAVYLIYLAGIYGLYRVLYHHPKKHHIRHIAMLVLTSGAAWFVAHILKKLINLPRPDLSHALITLRDMNSGGMPSGHAAFMFALATTMYHFDRKAGIILYILAIFVGIGRVLAGVHFWYDIVGGAVLGYAVSSVVVYCCKRLIRQW